MKIGLIIYGSLDTLSGGYLYDRHLVANLRAHGCQVDIWSLPWRDYFAHLSDNSHLAWAIQIADANYDLLLEDELNHPSLFLINHILHSLCDCPIISIVHHLRVSEAHPTSLMPFYGIVERLYLSSVDGFIYNSRTTRRTVEAQLGRTKSNIVAYPAADHREPPSRHEVIDAIARRLLSSDPLQLLFVGNLIPRKGLHILFNALERLSSNSWHLHIVGSPEIDRDYSAAMHHRANTLSLTTRLTWHGRLDDAALNQLFASSDLFVMPSYEGFGIVFLEAMAYGIPVIAADVGAAHEIIATGKNGYLVGADDDIALSQRINLLIKNRVQLATLAYFARQRFDEHPTWNDSMESAYLWLRAMQNYYKS